MSAPYLTPSETIFRAMIAMSHAGGFDVRPSDREKAKALDHRLLERIVVERPNLGPNGFRTPCDLETLAEFHSLQDRMTCSGFLGQFSRAIAFLSMCCGRRKTVNRRITSYALKHSAERAMEGLGVATPYVSNGALICAALALGYRIERIQDTPNCWLNLVVLEGGR